MTSATLRDVLSFANRERCAIAGLVVLGWEDARAYVEAAEQSAIPIILQAGPGCRAHTPVPILGKMFRTLADKASVPICCHIDHAYTEDECQAGIDHGFTSVMIDGSKLTISDNIALTQRVVRRAERAGVSVEGEVGFVGYAGGQNSAFTSPVEAELFDRESGADAIAISVGNVHLNTEKTNGIDVGALAAIEALTRLPLVIHGGSGVPSEMRQRLAREHRVRKYNVGTELRMAFGAALRASLAGQPREFDRIKLLAPTITPLRDATTALLRELRYPSM
jgi:fructose-bisphosphate aldolase, class II